MIFGIGNDIVEISRIEQALEKSDKFARRVLTEFEYAEYELSKQKPRYLAKKFAAKEAIVKAMGTGIGNSIGWHSLQIEHDEFGKPLIVTHKGALEFFKTHNITRSFLTLSDERHYAIACCVLEM